MPAACPPALSARTTWAAIGVTGEQVDAIERVLVDDFLGRHARARIELRVTPSTGHPGDE